MVSEDLRRLTGARAADSRWWSCTRSTASPLLRRVGHAPTPEGCC